jgi:hypothetical protein
LSSFPPYILLYNGGFFASVFPYFFCTFIHFVLLSLFLAFLIFIFPSFSPSVVLLLFSLSEYPSYHLPPYL